MFKAARDSFIGWDQRAREANLGFTTNNTRFLILPWVCVPNLASHILSLISKRLSSDWSQKYGHPIYLLETFVDRSRYKGTCYQALPTGFSQDKHKAVPVMTVIEPATPQ